MKSLSLASPVTRPLAVLLLALAAALGAALPLLSVKGALTLLVLSAGLVAAAAAPFALYVLLVAGLAFSVELDHASAGGYGFQRRPTEPLIPLLCGLALLPLILRGRMALTRTPLNAAIGAFLLAMLLTLPDATHPLVSVKGVVRDLLYIAAGYALCLFFTTTRARLYALLLSVLAANVALAAYGLATQLAGEVRIYGEVAEPFFENHCIYAAFLALSMSVVLSYLFETRTRGRLILSAALALWCVAVALTFVRGAWISLAAVVVFYLWMYRRQLSPRLLLLVVVAGLVVVAVAGGLQLKYLFEERLAHALDTGYVTNRDRLDRWGAAAQMFLSHPLNGVGWASYADEYFAYIYYLDAYSTEIRMGAHNLYLEIAAESGVLGLAAFAGLILVYYRRMARLARRLPRGSLRCLAIGLGGAMLSYLVHAFVNNLGPSDKIGISFWLLFGLLAVVERLSAQESEKAGDARPGD